MVLIDSNVIIDVLTDDQIWRAWSEQQLLVAASEEDIAINPVIYAELGAGYNFQSDLEHALRDWPLRRLGLPYDAGFRASRAFIQYRKEGGTKRSPLPDFYIGAHAEAEGFRLLTRDSTRYQTYFPTLQLVAPQAI